MNIVPASTILVVFITNSSYCPMGVTKHVVSFWTYMDMYEGETGMKKTTLQTILIELEVSFKT